MKTYLVVRIIGDKSFFIPKTKSFGDVDIRPGNNELDKEKRALENSSKAFGLSVNFDICPRLATIVSAEDEIESNKMAELRFEETLDCFDIYSYGLSDNTLLPIGYVVNLEDYKLTPLEPLRKRKFYTMFHIIEEKFPRIESFQYILSIQRNELSASLIRSGYWTRRARKESSNQLKFIYRWIALESLCKVLRNEDIIPKIMLSLGFIIGRYRLLINQHIIQNLHSKPEYRLWRRWLQAKLEDMRDYRNNTVHNAFRPHDIDEVELKNYTRIVGMTYPRLRNYVIRGILEGIETLQDFWEIVPILIEDNKYLVNGVHNTIIPILGSPLEEDWQF